MAETRRLGALTLQTVALAVLAVPIMQRLGMKPAPAMRARLELARRHGIDLAAACHAYRRQGVHRG